jgi:hypothetical protein
MMEFLRALAPSHATAKTRAVPVLRSRFDDRWPLTRLPAVHVETPAQSSQAENRERVATSPAITRSVERAREDSEVAATSADRAIVTQADGRVTMPLAPEPLSVLSTRETVAGAEHAIAVPRVVDDALALPRATQRLSVPLRAAAVPAGVTMPEPAAPAPARAPLSSNVVAARAESRSDARPVIHVTIDRIEVRAPSAPERPSSRPRVRSTTSASLSDYLRSRQSSRSGGSS